MSTKELERTNESQVEDQETLAVEAEALEPEVADGDCPPEADGLEDYEREWMQQVQEQEDEVAAKEATWLALKEEAAAAKKSFELAQSQLRRLVRQGPQKPAAPDPQQRLFGEEEPQQDDSWRQRPITELADFAALNPSDYSNLEKAGITTMGQLEDLRAGAGIASVKGFGPVAVERVTEALLAWLTEHRDKAAFEDARAASEPDSDEMTPEEFAQAALGLLNTIQFGKFPAEAEEFLESVADDLRAVRDTVERTGVVTERQREALTNWEEGVSKWLRH